MQKLIPHFGEDQKNIFNLIVKAVNIATDQLEAFRDYLQSKGIEIHAIARNSIEAVFAGEYLAVSDMIRELKQAGCVGFGKKRLKSLMTRTPNRFLT